MNALLEETIKAHGGLERWNAVESITANLDEGGGLWGLKGHPDMLGLTTVTVGTQIEWASHYPFLTARSRTRFEPNRVTIENEQGVLIEELNYPRASFAGHGLDTPWSRPQLAFFAGYAMWTYLNLPFVLAREDVVIKTGDTWEENGEVLRRLHFRLPNNIAAHSADQTLYIDKDGLFKRHDYDVDLSGGTPAAHYPSAYQKFGGIMFPTRRDIFPRQPDNTPDRSVLVVPIDLSNIELK